MSAIDATPGSAAANAYDTVEGVTAYFEDHVASAEKTAWLAADADGQRAAVIQATRDFDANVAWAGTATRATQALAFPRLGLVDPDNGDWVDDATIPARLKWAVAEQAGARLAGSRTAELPQHTQGLKRLVAGPVELEFNEGAAAAARPVLFAPAFQFVACWGRMAQGSLGGAVPLLRI